MQAIDHYSGTNRQIFKSRQDIMDEISKPVPRKQQISVSNIAVSVSDFCSLVWFYKSQKASALDMWMFSLLKVIELGELQTLCWINQNFFKYTKHNMDEHTEHNPFLLNFQTTVKHELKERQSNSSGRGGKSPHWGWQLPTLWSDGTLLFPAGTCARGSWGAHRRPRHPQAPGQSEPLGDSSGRAGCSDLQCTPTSDRQSQDARTHEPWTH